MGAAARSLFPCIGSVKQLSPVELLLKHGCSADLSHQVLSTAPLDPGGNLNLVLCGHSLGVAVA